MKLKSIITGVLFLLITVSTVNAQGKIKFKLDKQLLKEIDNNFIDAANQYKVLMKNLPADKFPKTFFPETGKYEFSNSGWWCSAASAVPYRSTTRACGRRRPAITSTS